MKLDLNKNLQDLDGKDIENAHLGQSLASILATGRDQTISPLKMFDWARTLHAKEPLTLDRADAALLKEFVTGNNVMTVLLKAQLLIAMEEGAEVASLPGGGIKKPKKP